MVALGLVTTEHLEGKHGDSGWSLVGRALWGPRQKQRSLECLRFGCALSRCETPRNPAPDNGGTVIQAKPEKCSVFHIPQLHIALVTFLRRDLSPP